MQAQEYLTSQDGAKSVGKMAQGHADTKGCEAANDKLAESIFGAFDRVLRQFGGISREAAAAVAQARGACALALGWGLVVLSGARAGAGLGRRHRMLGRSMPA